MTPKIIEFDISAKNDILAFFNKETDADRYIVI